MRQQLGLGGRRPAGGRCGSACPPRRSPSPCCRRRPGRPGPRPPARRRAAAAGAARPRPARARPPPPRRGSRPRRPCRPECSAVIRGSFRCRGRRCRPRGRRQSRSENPAAAMRSRNPWRWGNSRTELGQIGVGRAAVGEPGGRPTAAAGGSRRGRAPCSGWMRGTANSSTTSRPPGRSTPASWRRAASRSATLRSPKETVAPAKRRGGEGEGQGVGGQGARAGAPRRGRTCAARWPAWGCRSPPPPPARRACAGPWPGRRCRSRGRAPRAPAGEAESRGGLAAPDQVQVGREQMVEQVVAGGDAREHVADGLARFVEGDGGGLGHTRRSVSRSRRGAGIDGKLEV